MAPRVGANNSLIAEQDRRIVRTGRAERIAALVDRLPDVRLIILDPVSRFRDGNENDNQTATRLVEVLESLREMTDATVLAPHHVAKAGAADGELTQDMLRGASALVDGFRWPRRWRRCARTRHASATASIPRRPATTCASTLSGC